MIDRAYNGMKRCRFCSMQRRCSVTKHPNELCALFISGGVRPEIAVDMEARRPMTPVSLVVQEVLSHMVGRAEIMRMMGEE